MSERTEIAWTDSTFNGWIGCQKVGPGCDHCYAEREFDHRHHRAKWGPGQERVRTSAHNWRLPLRWNAKPFAECPSCGHRGEPNMVSGLLPGGEQMAVCPECKSGPMRPARRRVFCASLSDVFDNAVPAQWRVDMLRLIADTPNLDWLLLTKRISNVQKMMVEAFSMGWPNHASTWERWPELFRNVWIGATICNQEEADRDIPKLLAVPARVRFVSMEPLLGPVSLNLATACDRQCSEFQNAECPGYSGLCVMQAALDWVIVGGESGPKARPMHPAWVRSLRDQCFAAGVPFLFKQWGEHDHRTIRVGKKAAGRLLDGKLHNEFPEVAP